MAAFDLPRKSKLSKIAQLVRGLPEVATMADELSSTDYI